MSANRHLKISLSLILALAALLLPLLSIAGASGIPADETPLNPEGTAWELNLESQGTLWVSDVDAGEIWSFTTSSEVRTVYQVGGGPSDARGDSAGSVWWVDYRNNRFGRLTTSANQATIWEIPGSALWGTAIDSNGDVWASDYSASLIYRLDPGTNQLCTYTLPDHGLTRYLFADGEALWLGEYLDQTDARILRLQGDTFNWWKLPAGSFPRDLEMDGNSRLWWADPGKGYLGRLDSAAATITTFTPPPGGSPVMLALSNGKVWASLRSPSGVAELNPAVAASQTVPVTTGSQAAAPDCDELLPLAPVAVAATTAQVSWTGETYPTALDTAGWKIYQMPIGGFPWGIAATEEKVWLVDQGRQVLARLSPSPESTNIYLPLLQRQ